MSGDNFVGLEQETTASPGKRLPKFQNRSRTTSPHTYDVVQKRAKEHIHRKGGRYFPAHEAPVQMPAFHDDTYKSYKEQKYKSTVRYAEQKLREAVDAAQEIGAGLPHVTLTAVAMHCLESLSREETPFAEVLSKIFEILCPAVYRDTEPGKGKIPYEDEKPYFALFKDMNFGAMDIITEAQATLTRPIHSLSRRVVAASQDEIKALKQSNHDLEYRIECMSR